LVARGLHRFNRDTVGLRPRLTAHSVADGATAELQRHVIAEQARQLVRPPGAECAQDDRHRLAQIASVQTQENTAEQITGALRLSLRVAIALDGRRIDLGLADGGQRSHLAIMRTNTP
jgi:hypothetical protein